MQIRQKIGNSQALKVNPVLYDARQDKTRQNVRKTNNRCFPADILKENLFPFQPRSPLACGVGVGVEGRISHQMQCINGKEQEVIKGQGEWAGLAGVGRAGPMARAEPDLQILIHPVARHLLLVDVPTLQRGHSMHANTQ